MAEGKRKVDVGLPVPLGDYLYLPPVQTGMNDAVEEKAMNPVLAWLAGQGIDVAAEQTGIKDVLRERGAGLLNMLGIGDAQAADVQDNTPVQTGFEPTTRVVAQDVIGTPIPETSPSYVPDSAIPMEGRRLPTGGQILVRQDWEGPGRGPATGVTGNQDGVRQLPPISKWAMDDNTPPVNDKEVDEAIKESAPGSMLGRLWDSTLGDEEWRLRKAMILNSMRLNPDAALTQAFAARIKDLRSKRRGNKTADYLESIGKVKEAEMVRRFPDAASEILAQVAKVPDWRSKMDFAIQNPELAKKASELGIFGSGTTINVGGQQMTPGREAMDKEYAKEHVAWISTGGADMSGQLAQIQTVLDKLERGEELTGPAIGMAPDFYLYLTNPEAIDARQRVEEVVQRNLRVILGAQFTEKEGERLISRAYDPKLSAEQNAARLRRLITQMRSAVEQRNEMARYFEEYGTLAGYVGKRPSVDDFYRAIEGKSRSALKAGDVVDGWTFMGGDPGDKSAWKKKGAE